MLFLTSLIRDDPYKNRPESYYGTPEEEAATYPQLKLLQGEAFVAHLPQDGKNAKLHLFFRIRFVHFPSTIGAHLLLELFNSIKNSKQLNLLK